MAISTVLPSRKRVAPTSEESIEPLSRRPRVNGPVRKVPTSPSQRERNITIGVMGRTHDASASHLAEAFELGRAIGINGCTLITGACGGVPLAAARGARQEGALVIGISPGLSLVEHVSKYDSPVHHHDVLVFTGAGLMGREVINISSCEMVVIAGGHAGTLGELAIAYVEGKIIGVLSGIGGVSKIAREVLRVCHKNSGARALYDKDPHRLVARMLSVYRARSAAENAGVVMIDTGVLI
ncbi:MAG: hypothetical protein ACLQAT_18165 [Candidatus Binataceae bacterium]